MGDAEVAWICVADRGKRVVRRRRRDHDEVDVGRRQPGAGERHFCGARAQREVVSPSPAI